MHSKEMCMEFGISKCIQITLKRGKILHNRDLKPLDWKFTDKLKEKVGYKYLAILVATRQRKN